MNNPHPLLIPLLEEFELTWEVFSKKGRPPKGVFEKRSKIVTALHERGHSWQELQDITGLSLGGVQRLTQGVGCPAMREKRRKIGAALGRTWKGKSRPGQLASQWAKGDFDSLVGRKRTPQEIENAKLGWTEEKRRAASKRSKAMWEDPEYRDNLLSFHRSGEERIRRSQLQSQRMIEDPIKWTRGKGSWVESAKSKKGRFWVRSSYEQRSVELLDCDPSVKSFEYERQLKLASGKYIRPDFIVEKFDGSITLVEVKASWVLSQPKTHKAVIRLRIAEVEALRRGWAFKVWTEEELF